MVEIKRNTTPTLPVIVETPLENVKELEFIFKRRIDPTCPTLVRKKYSADVAGGIPVREGNSSEMFTVLMKLKARETAALLAGEAYMDTRIVFKDGTVPQTDIVPARIRETLFWEVYDDDEGEGQS